MMVKIEISDRAYKRCVEAAALAGVSLDDWLLAAGISGVRLDLNLYALCERAAQMCNMSAEEYMSL